MEQLGGALTNYALEKGVEWSVKIIQKRFFHKRIIEIKNLKFCLVFYFYTCPKYDKCLYELTKALRDIKEKNKFIRWKGRTYLYDLKIGQKNLDILQLLYSEIFDDDVEESILESIIAEDIRIYLYLLYEGKDKISDDVFKQILEDSYELLIHVEEQVKQTKLEIRDAWKFIEFALDENIGTSFLSCINNTKIPNKDHYDKDRNQRIIDIQIKRNRDIDYLIDCLHSV